MIGAICDAGNEHQREKTLFELSRPVGQDEQIDYFMSHSWHDNADAKWAALQRAAEEFRASNGSYPTFWLDKVCIDQNNIGDGLRVMPDNQPSGVAVVLARAAPPAAALDDDDDDDAADVKAGDGPKGSIRKQAWTAEEDAKLLELVTTHGPSNWSRI